MTGRRCVGAGRKSGQAFPVRQRSCPRLRGKDVVPGLTGRLHPHKNDTGPHHPPGGSLHDPSPRLAAFVPRSASGPVRPAGRQGDGPDQGPSAKSAPNSPDRSARQQGRRRRGVEGQQGRRRGLPGDGMSDQQRLPARAGPPVQDLLRKEGAVPRSQLQPPGHPRPGGRARPPACSALPGPQGPRQQGRRPFRRKTNAGSVRPRRIGNDPLPGTHRRPVRRSATAGRAKPTRRDLAEALDEVLAGKPVSWPKTEPAGCFIARMSTPKTEGAVTFTEARQPHSSEELSGVPPARTDRPDGAADLRRRGRVGRDDPRSG